MQNSRNDKWLAVLFYAFTIVFAALCLYPFLLVIASSFTEEATLLRNGYRLLPEAVSLNAYKAIFSTNTIPDAYLVTIFITVAGTALSLLVTSLAAYSLSGSRLRYAPQLALFFYFTMLFSGGMVSSYILTTRYLHLQDTIWVYILPAVLSPWNLFLMRNFFNDIPKELFESVKLDGAGGAADLALYRAPAVAAGAGHDRTVLCARLLVVLGARDAVYRKSEAVFAAIYHHANYPQHRYGAKYRRIRHAIGGSGGSGLHGAAGDRDGHGGTDHFPLSVPAALFRRGTERSALLKAEHGRKAG
ncbi:carbohydrate ABC transporter permease [Cohnella ginsengisoli]|uniref:Carbohydrate ABC transporter permease n=1 Tax=Cohnella ginsengisoli TaxID=425004 RepID=A0A9X4KEY5_9BACL|nr:carbohydrate ABC transporter permease [Cohnella ginsengisoli]MDG0790842.1 carbohydrate ABC transporter permease [Cohnella ginsengisoli]